MNEDGVKGNENWVKGNEKRRKEMKKSEIKRTNGTKWDETEQKERNK